MSNKELSQQRLIDKEVLRYKNLLCKMISDSDFSKYITDAPEKLIKYCDLSNYSNINDILPNDKDFKIILTESKKNEGHWCVLCKYNNIIEWFDSYGVAPDGELKFISNAMRKLLGEDKNFLSNLLKTCNKNQKVIYNKKKLQMLKDGINTCGRWCIARLILLHINYDLKEFINFMKKMKKDYNMPYDLIICDFIDL